MCCKPSPGVAPACPTRWVGHSTQNSTRGKGYGPPAYRLKNISLLTFHFLPQPFLASAHQEREAVDVLQGDTRTAGYGAQRVFGDMERKTRFLVETTVETLDEGTAAC